MKVLVWTPFSRRWVAHHYTEDHKPLRHPCGSVVITEASHESPA